MAISPNDDFTAGQVLTATECNQFPRGVMQYVQAVANDAAITIEEIELTLPSFTAVASRYYKFTYYEPQITTPATAGATVTARIRLTNLAGNQYQNSFMQNAPATAKSGTLTAQWVGTLSAGATVIVATLQCSSGTASATRSANAPAFLLVEDIGPA